MNVFRNPRVLVLILLTGSLRAQQGGYIAGMVRDRSGDAIAGAEVRVQSQNTGARQELYCDSSGYYSTSEIRPGLYRITVRSEGFRTRSYADVKVVGGKKVRADFAIDLLPLREEMTVSAAQSDVDPAVSGLTVSRGAPTGNLPENGRDIHALYNIMPGATVTPASISNGGQFTVSGQRPNANSFWVDGISGNVGIGVVSLPGAILGATLPGMTAIGGLQSLASKEETEQVDLRSADFSAEFGDRPGAQISIETRAGSNEFHGSAFGYIRPHALDSLDWFARGAGIDLPSAFLDGWGGGLGGPLWRNHTFFFASFEKADVRDSALQLIPVPSPIARAQAGLPYQALFDSFPQPQSRSLNTDESLGYSPLQNDARTINRSVRLDQEIGNHLQLFARYSSVPSLSSNIYLGTASSTFHWSSATLGLNFATGQFTQEIRFNYSNVAANSQQDPYNTSAADSINVVLGDYAVTRVSIEGVGQTIAGAAAQQRERQFAGNYNIVRQAGRHELRAGFTYAKLVMNNNYNDDSTLSLVSPGIEALLSGIPLGLTTSYGGFAGTTTQRYSAFAQDSLRLTDRLHLLLGLRWDVTPSSFPSASPSYAPANQFQIGYWNGISAQPVQFPNLISAITATESRWPTRYNQVSPRFGLAYHLKWPDVVLRVGAGLFYDTGLGSIISNINPLNIWQFVPNSAAPVAPAVSSSSPPSPVLSLPMVWEWRASLEKSFRERSLFSVSYFGSAGQRLLRDESTIDPQSGILESFEFTSQGRSDYNALMAQFRGQLTSRLFALISYTWGHSIDTGSSDTSPVLADGPSNKGSSSFDVRHSLAASLSYQTPSHLGPIFGGWTLSSTALARTGFPFNVTTVDQSVGLGFENADRANLVPGQPIWIGNTAAPGGRELNPAAFAAPADSANGTLGRNVLTGPGLFQLDASLRRQFRLYGRSSMEATVSAFNLPNHPAFSNPVGYLGSGLFGQSNSTTNLMLGSGSPTTGLTPLFQDGGPRTIELSLRFNF